MHIIIGVTGGIAAYKTAALVSSLVQQGHEIGVVMTAAAREFVAPATFQALTGRAVTTDLFDPSFPLGAHIELADWAKLLCVAPASADFLAKAANGLADDLLSTLILSFTGPVLLAPAMNAEMWNKRAVQRNVNLLREDGCHFTGPGEGWQSCRRGGVGRMVEPEGILATIEELLNGINKNQ